MKLSDRLLLVANLFAAFMAFVGLAEDGGDAVEVALLLAMLTALTTAGVLLRRHLRARKGTSEVREAADELDAYRILEIDERLEALERAEARRLSLRLGSEDGARAAALVDAAGAASRGA